MLESPTQNYVNNRNPQKGRPTIRHKVPAINQYCE
nr:MAG TPA: hypothetical protein [Caudoviricetes sp.]